MCLFLARVRKNESDIGDVFIYLQKEKDKEPPTEQVIGVELKNDHALFFLFNDFFVLFLGCLLFFYLLLVLLVSPFLFTFFFEVVLLLLCFVLY